MRHHWGGMVVILCKMVREGLTEKAICELRLERARGMGMLQAQVTSPEVGGHLVCLRRHRETIVE